MPTTSIAAVCAGPGFGAARTCTSDTDVAGHNLSLLMRQLIGAGTPKEAVAGGIGALFVLVTPAGAVLVVQIVLIVSEDGETAFAAICFAVA